MNIDVLRRIAERGLKEAQASDSSVRTSQIDMWQHMLDEIGRIACEALAKEEETPVQEPGQELWSGLRRRWYYENHKDEIQCDAREAGWARRDGY
jgi:hypothetical protein